MFFYTRFFVLLIGVISLNTLIISCDLVSSDDEDDEEEQETIIREETVAIEPEDAPILEREDDRLIFELTDATPEIEVDNIIVGEEDGGFLRKAASVEIEDDRVVVETEEASLVDAIESGSLSESLDPSNAQGQDIRWEIKDKAEGVELQSEPQDLQWRYTLEDVDIASQIEGISVGLSDGEVSFTPQMHLDFDISLGRIEEFRLSQEGTLEFHTDIGIIAGDDMSISDDYSLITFQTQPVVYFIGWVPVTVRYIMDFVASYDIGLDSTTELSTGIETSNSIEIGARYNQEWERITEWQEESDYRGFEWQEPEFEAEGYVTVRPELSVSFYEALGPFINAGPYLEAMASISPFDWSWLLIAGLDTEFGGTLEILDYELASYSYTHTIWEDQLGSDEGEEQPDEYEIEVEVYGQGSVDKEPGRSTYTHGEEVTLTADPDQDWEFDEWNGDLAGSENPKTIEVTEDMWIEAEFVESDNGDQDGTVTDINGNEYETVIIGDQEWMAENLKVTRYRDGTEIPSNLNESDWENTTDGAYAIYPHTGGEVLSKDAYSSSEIQSRIKSIHRSIGQSISNTKISVENIEGINSDEEMIEAYGKLYNWYAIDHSAGLCPEGWRVPDNDDWQQLFSYIGGTDSPNGNQIKSRRQIGTPLGGEFDTDEHPRWEDDDSHYGTDDFGFSGVPAGVRDVDGLFYLLGYDGSWLSASEGSQFEAFSFGLSNENGAIIIYEDSKNVGESVRCMRNN